MKKLFLVVGAFWVAQAFASAPIHLNGLGGGWLSSTFSYAAAPGGTPATLTFSVDAPGMAVIGPIGGPDLWGKTVSLSVDVQGAMASLNSSIQGGSFSQSFAAQGHVDVTVLNAAGLSNLLSAAVNGGMIQVDVATRQVVAEFQLTSLSSAGLYLSGKPAQLRLEGKLMNAASLGRCADYAYKASCLPGEQFLSDFGTDPWSVGNWSVSSDAFVSGVPEPTPAALLLLGGVVLVYRFRQRAARSQA